MRRTYLLVIVSILVVLFTSCGYSAQSTSSTESTTEASEASRSELFSDTIEYTIEDAATFTSDDAHFSVKYPKDWDIEPEPYKPATDYDDGSLMWGVRIYLAGSDNSSEFIDIFKGQGHASGYLSFPQQDFITTNMTRGKLSHKLEGGEHYIAVSFNEFLFHGVIIRVSEAHFIAYKSQILGVLKSIEINE
jgi:hypothetical protein